MKHTFWFIFLILSSCQMTGKNDNPFSVITQFPVEEELTAEVISIPPIAMTPFNIFTTEDKLVMYNLQKDSIFDVFSLPECNYLFSAGYKGEGPNDFMDVDRRLFVPTKNGFKVFFQSHKELKEVQFRDKSIEVVKDSILKFEIDQYPVNGFTPLNDSIFIYWSGFGKETEYDLLNRNTKEIIPFSPYPEWAKQENAERLFTYIKNMTVKPDGKGFAAFYGYFKRFRIYDDKGNLLKDISLEIEPYASDFETEVNSRMVYYFAYPKSSNEYIYALCKNAKADAEAIPELQIWRWDGTPVGKYKLDRHITLFSISEKYEKMYAVNGENEEEIYVFSLPKEVKFK